MSGWFGLKAWNAPVCVLENRVPIPVGAPCWHCDEPIAADDDGFASGQRAVHYACQVRGLVGGANHIIGTCSCCGGTMPPDPPGLTRREAAVLAEKLWRETQFSPTSLISCKRDKPDDGA